jgi:hypothetical protein
MLILYLEQLLQDIRNNLSRAQKDTQEAFLRYTSCLETERRARQELAAAEQHYGGLSEPFHTIKFSLSHREL